MGESANRGGINVEASVNHLMDFFVLVVVYATKVALLTDQISLHLCKENRSMMTRIEVAVRQIEAARRDTIDFFEKP